MEQGGGVEGLSTPPSPATAPTASLVSDVFQGGGNVNLLGALVHAVEDHVDENVGAGAPNAVTRGGQKHD